MAPGIAALTIGTSGAVRITTPKPILEFPAMLFSYVLDETRFVCGGPVNNGGNVLQWLIRKFWGRKAGTELDYAAFFEQIQTVAAGSEGLLFLPYIYGERAPVWDEHAKGAFLGVTEDHSTAHFLRAGLEGICFALRQVVEMLETSTAPLHEVHVSGGFTQSPEWVQLLANVLGKTLTVHEAADASAFGGALMAMKAAGWTNGYLASNTSKRSFSPDSSCYEAYERSYQIFKQVYQAVKQVQI
jgi:gluconokinase